MDKLTLFLVRMLILQCFLQWCSSVKTNFTLESFKRCNEKNRFLEAARDKGKKVSFKGSREDDNTTFTFSRGTNPFIIYLANDPGYVLAFDDNLNSLVVKKLPNTTGDKTTMGDHFFSKRRVSRIRFKNNNTYFLHVIEPQASVGKYIKSDKFGEVSLGLEKDCGCWIRIKATSTGA